MVQQDSRVSGQGVDVELCDAVERPRTGTLPHREEAETRSGEPILGDRPAGLRRDAAEDTCDSVCRVEETRFLKGGAALYEAECAG